MRRQHTFIVLVTALLGGCAGLHGYDSVDALRQDALAVFKEHNQTAGEVMLVVAELDPTGAVAFELGMADAAMLLACEPLNEMAIAQRDGQRTSLRKRSRIPETIEACRQSTRRTRLLLDSI